LGARLFYWFYLFLTLAGVGGAAIYWFREALKKRYFILRFPEKLIIVAIIYPGNKIRRFARLIPDDNTFDFGDQTYNYAESSVLKNNTWYAYKDKAKEERLILNIESKEYYLDDLLKIKQRWERWPEIYYKYGCPLPINFWAEGETEAAKDKAPIVEFNAHDLSRLKKSTILTQIYNSMGQNNLMVVVIILLFIVLLGVVVIILNNAGVIHLAQAIPAAVVKK